MKRFFPIFLIAVFFLPLQSWSLDVVPGLKVFGGATRAAYGNSTNPSICIVNTLNPTAAITNSTRNGVAVKTGGLKSFIDWNVDNKMIFFEVGGAIVYYGEMKIDNNYVTIAGQTAPSPGISLYGTQLTVTGNDVLIQHIRVRAGDNSVGVGGEQRNAIESYGNNNVFDHCSFSWAPDGNVGMSNSTNSTYSNCIVSEGLAYSIHGENPNNTHSTGMYVSNTSTSISIINNLIAHNSWRSPEVDGNGQSVLVANNIIYNPGVYNYYSYNVGKSASDYNIVGNLSIGGLNSVTHVKEYFIDVLHYQNSSTDFYIYDNKVCDEQGGICNTQDSTNDWDHVRMVDGQIETDTKTTNVAFSYPTDYTPMAVSSVEAYVLANVGARPDDRDEVDARIVADVSAGTGTLIDTIEYVNADCTGLDTGPNGIVLACCTGAGTGTCVQNNEGGWPSIGIRSITHNDLPADPHGDDDDDGYTNLEEWIHTLSAVVEGSSEKTLLSPPDKLKILQ